MGFWLIPPYNRVSVCAHVELPLQAIPLMYMLRS